MAVMWVAITIMILGAFALLGHMVVLDHRETMERYK